MAADGYYRWPALHGDDLVFVCEDTLWHASLDRAAPKATGTRQLTAVGGAASRPCHSRNGRRVAFTVRDNGCEEVYLVDAGGGPSTRLTHLGADTAEVVGWDGDFVLFASSAQQPIPDTTEIWRVPAAGGHPAPLGTGPASHLAVHPEVKTRVLGRHTCDPATSEWKRYRGGRCGQLWVDLHGAGKFARVDPLPSPGNIGPPVLIPYGGGPELLAFVSDHSGVGRVYTYLVEGSPLVEAEGTDRGRDFYARHLTVDAAVKQGIRTTATLAFTAGGEIWVCGTGFGEGAEDARKVEVEWRGPRGACATQRPSAEDELDDVALHPEGTKILALARGQVFTLGCFDGPALAFPSPSGRAGRARLAEYLFDGARIAIATDASGEDGIEVHWEDDSQPPMVLRLPPSVLGRAEEMAASPQAPLLAVVNHRKELVIVDAGGGGAARVADRCEFAGGICAPAWSPCGNWVAYSCYSSALTAEIRILDVRTGAVHPASDPVLVDDAPAWDPDGKSLYFISSREFEPVVDETHVGMGFPRAQRPYMVTLQKSAPSGLLRELRPPCALDGAGEDSGSDDEDELYSDDESEEGPPEPVAIDVEGLPGRCVALPARVGRYGQLAALPGGKVLYTVFSDFSHPVGWDEDDSEQEDEESGALRRLDIATMKEWCLISEGVQDVVVSQDYATMLVRIGGEGEGVYAYPAGERVEDEDEDEEDTADPQRTRGLVDVGGRVRIEVHPPSEWAQMLREVWRRLRDDAWAGAPGLAAGAGAWDAVWERHARALPRIACASEAGDLLTELVAEAGCSHAWWRGVDPATRDDSLQRPGVLGADFVWDPEEGGYRITHLVHGDTWHASKGGALAQPGVGVREGDVLLSIDRVPLTESMDPARALAHKGGCEVLLAARCHPPPPTLDEKMAKMNLGGGGRGGGRGRGRGGDGGKRGGGGRGGGGRGGDAKPPAPETRRVRVRAMTSDTDARYRDLIAARRAAAHKLSSGQVGYLHVPDMERFGFSEFHRFFAVEAARAALVVDLRGNAGGHVSELLLHKLAARTLGFEEHRWGAAEPYPAAARSGPVVLIADETVGSDGEVAALAFRQLGLGPVVGARTWGGCTANEGTEVLADGSTLGVPTLCTVLADEGRAVENWGVDADVAVVHTPPGDFSAGPGQDRVLLTAVVEAQKRCSSTVPPAAPGAAPPSRAGGRGPQGDWPFRQSTWAPLVPVDVQDSFLPKHLRGGGRGGGGGGGGRRG